MDYSTDGKFDDRKGWQIFDDENYLIKAKPRGEPIQPTFVPLEDPDFGELNSQRKVAQSWEKQETDMVGKNEKDDNWKKFIGHPTSSFLQDFGDTVQAVWMVQEFNIK